MDFFEEDEPTKEPPSRRRPAGQRPSATDADFEPRPRKSAEKRAREGRLRLAAVAIVAFIIIVFLLRSCQQSQKERAFENYVRDLSAITVETEQLSENFFGALGGGGGEGDLAQEGEINSLRGTAQGLVNRVQNLDAPDELKASQAELILSYNLREEAIDTVAEKLPDAQARQGARRAIRDIAEQMEALLASDVLYRRARVSIQRELEEQEIFIEGDVPESEFLPTGKNDPNYLNSDELGSLITSGGSGNAGPAPDDGLRHGLGLASTTIGGVALSSDTGNTVGADASEIEVSVQNQGEATENGIEVTIGGDFNGSQRIDTIEPGETQSVALALTPSPSAGDTATIDVDVATVPGEQVADNNSASYEVTFGP